MVSGGPEEADGQDDCMETPEMLHAPASEESEEAVSMEQKLASSCVQVGDNGTSVSHLTQSLLGLNHSWYVHHHFRVILFALSSIHSAPFAWRK